MTGNTAPATRAGGHPAVDAHLPSLDGLRAISIVLVLLGHLNGTRGCPPLNFGVGNYAHLGVVVFFVISGFLITTLLLSEFEKTGSVSLKLFYARRSLRIFPAAYAYLVLMILFTMVGVYHLSSADLWHAATYTVNFHSSPSWEVGHLWSLSVEEQFYLLWPFTFVVLAPRKATWAAAGMLVVAVAARIANRLLLIGTPYHSLPMFPMVADSLATGCLLAWQRNWLQGQTWYRALMRPFPSLVVLAVVLLLNRYQNYTIIEVFGSSLINVGIALLIHRSVYYAETGVGRALNWSPFASLGKLSYSLYLWQQIFLNRNSDRWMQAFPQNLIFAFGAAMASYFLLEQPLLQLRRRLRNQAPAGHRQH